MKLSLLGPLFPFRGGIAHHTMMLSHALQRAHDLQVISFKHQFPSLLYPGRTDRDPSKESLKQPALRILSPYNPFCWWQAANHIQNFDSKVAILQWWTTFWAPGYSMLARRLHRMRIPTVFLVHNVLPHEKGIADPILARMALKNGDAFLVHGPQQEQLLLQLLPSAPIVSSPHPPYSFFSPGTQTQQEARQELRIPADGPLLLFFGIVRPYKGLAILIEAMAKLHSQGLFAHLVIAGEFWEAPGRYHALIKNLGLDAFIHIHNAYVPNEEAGKYFTASDLLIAPYIAGTQSGALAAAVGMGLPAITSEHMLSSISVPSQNMVTAVPPGNPSALANAIRNHLTATSPQRKEPIPVSRFWDLLAKDLEETIQLAIRDSNRGTE